VRGCSYSPASITPDEDPESEQDFEMTVTKVAQLEDCGDRDRPLPTAVQGESVGLAMEEKQEHQEERLGKYLQSCTGQLLGHVNEHPCGPTRPASPEVTMVSDNSAAKVPDSMPIPDPDTWLDWQSTSQSLEIDSTSRIQEK
jgi:hypothetical protein